MNDSQSKEEKYGRDKKQKPDWAIWALADRYLEAHGQRRQNCSQQEQ